MPVLLQSAVTHSASLIRTQSVQRKLPILFGVLAIALNNIAVIATEMNWLFSTAGTIFLLLAAKTYTANRANALLETVQTNTEYSNRLRRQLVALQRRTTRKIKVRAKGDRRLKKRVKRLVSRVKSASNIISQLDAQVQSLQARLGSEEDSFETIRSSATQILQKADVSIKTATLALDKAHRTDANVKASKNAIQGIQDSLSYQHWCYYLCTSSLWQSVYQQSGCRSAKEESPVVLQPQVSADDVRSLLLAHDQMAGNSFYKSLDNYDELILVHQMGKVGSMSIYSSLKSIDELAPRVFHTHILNSEIILKSLYSALVHPNRIYLHSNHWLDSLYVLNKLNESNPQSQKMWKVITLVRDPIARNISAYFQNIRLEIAFPKSIERGEIDAKELDEAIEEFTALKNYRTPLSWMDRQIKEVFGIDVYQEDFDCDKGYSIIQKDNINLLVIKLEKLETNHKEAFHELLGLENFQLKSSNVSDSKQYASIYKAFKDRITFSKEYIELIYSSELATHFYTPQELETFRSKWAKNTM